MFSTAITRKPGSNFAQGIRASDSGEPHYGLILEQHSTYVEALETAGLEVIELPPLADYPDAYFVEDVAVVTPDVAVITNPGAASRNGEQDTIAPVLSAYREIARIEPPGTLDGGDVLMVEKHFFIGISARTNASGATQLGGILERFDKTWTRVPVGEGLHLKSSVNWLGGKALLISKTLSSQPEFDGYTHIQVDPAEEYACNTLWVNNTLLTPKGFPKTRKQLTASGLPIIELETSEAQKMDGGLTCMSIRF